jgi:hypothetical protein
MKNSNYTGLSARDMKSAFGPYTDSTLHPMPEPRHVYSRAWWVVVYVLSVIALITIYFTR